MKANLALGIIALAIVTLGAMNIESISDGVERAIDLAFDHPPCIGG